MKTREKAVTYEVQKQRFERVCRALQNVTSQKALDDNEEIRIKSEFSQEPQSSLQMV